METEQPHLPPSPIQWLLDLLEESLVSLQPSVVLGRWQPGRGRAQIPGLLSCSEGLGQTRVKGWGPSRACTELELWLGVVWCSCLGHSQLTWPLGEGNQLEVGVKASLPRCQQLSWVLPWLCCNCRAGSVSLPLFAPLWSSSKHPSPKLSQQPDPLKRFRYWVLAWGPCDSSRKPSFLPLSEMTQTLLVLEYFSPMCSFKDVPELQRSCKAA